MLFNIFLEQGGGEGLCPKQRSDHYLVLLSQLHPDLLPEGGLPPVEEAAALLGAQSEVAHGNAGAAALMGGRLCAMSAPNAGPLSPAWIEVPPSRPPHIERTVNNQTCVFKLKYARRRSVTCTR
jgi:hypothetical protein